LGLPSHLAEHTSGLACELEHRDGCRAAWDLAAAVRDQLPKVAIRLAIVESGASAGARRDVVAGEEHPAHQWRDVDAGKSGARAPGVRQ